MSLIDEKTKKDLNVGDDPRLWPWFVFRWQKLTQVSFMKHWDTVLSISPELFPPGCYYNFSLPWKKPDHEYHDRETKQHPKSKQKVYPVVNIRASWLWLPFSLLCFLAGWSWWSYIIAIILGLFLNWRRDRNSSESYWTLSINIDHEAKRW